MKSFQIFSSVKDATILAADTSGLLKNAKVKVSFEFVQYLRNGVFVVVEDLHELKRHFYLCIFE